MLSPVVATPAAFAEGLTGPDGRPVGWVLEHEDLLVMYAQREYVAMQMQDVDHVTRLIAPRKGEHLVHGEVDGMKKETDPVVLDGRHESPARVSRPFDLRRVFVPAHDRTDIARLLKIDLD